MMQRFFAAVIMISMVLLPASVVLAQVSEGGAPFGLIKALPVDVQPVRMAAVDVPALMAEDKIEEAQGLPYRFGYAFDVDYNLENSGTWSEAGNGDRIWRMYIESPGAYSINLIYSHYDLPEGAKLFLYNPDFSAVLGAFTARNNKEHGQFATAPVKGEVTILEYFEPAAARGRGQLAISRIIHAYKDIFNYDETKDLLNYGESGSCNNNINCPEGQPWQNEKRAVAMILTGGGARICTGALVNNVRQDQIPYLLTANHCLGGETTWIFMFNYESPDCTNTDGPTTYTVSGSTLCANNATSDFALLRLSEQPPLDYNVYYAGWSNIDSASQSSTCLHHPEGDIKKISFDTEPVTSANYLSTTGTNHWRIGSWNDGTTEPGSSGAPLFDQNHHIVGQLHGGYASCTSLTSDWFGKFSLSWTGGGTSATRLRDWLDSDVTGVAIINGLDPHAAITIIHTPLPNTIDTLNAYDVQCTITASAGLLADSLLLYYAAPSTWSSVLLLPTGAPDAYHAFIPAQSAGITIDYYLSARTVDGISAVSDTFTFLVEHVAAIAVSPLSFSATLRKPDSASEDLVIGNAALGSLSYSVAVVPRLRNSPVFEKLAAAGAVEPAKRNYSDEFLSYEDIKGAVDSRRGFPVEKNAGGPDLFGYFWLDSDEPGGLVFSWTDISSIGSDVTAALADDNYIGPLEIGFPFSYYGNTYHQFYLGSNGIIGFDTTAMKSRSKTNLPSTATPNNLLAWLWDDLDPTDPNNPGAHVYVYSNSSQCIIEFVAYPEYAAGAGDVITAEVILGIDGSVTFLYLSIAPGFDIASCAIGMENSDGTDGLEVVFLSPYLHDNLAVRLFRPYPWLVPDKNSGSLAFGEADTIACRISTLGLDSGTYMSDIIITSNDPDPMDNPWIVPFQLTVQPAYVCGDANGDMLIDVGDAVFMVNYIFKGGLPPSPLGAADANCDGNIDLGDAVHIVNYIFKYGPQPCCP